MPACGGALGLVLVTTGMFFGNAGFAFEVYSKWVSDIEKLLVRSINGETLFVGFVRQS